MSGNSLLNNRQLRVLEPEPDLPGPGGSTGGAQQEPTAVDPEGARAGLDSFIAGQGSAPAPAPASTLPGADLDPRDVDQRDLVQDPFSGPGLRDPSQPAPTDPGGRNPPVAQPPSGGNTGPARSSVANQLFSRTASGASVVDLAGRLRRRRGRSASVLGGR